MRSKLAQNRVDKNEEKEQQKSMTRQSQLKRLSAVCLASHSRKARRFKLTAEIPKYDGTQEPEAWLDDYLTAVRFQKGKETTTMQYIQLQMVGAARS